MEPVAAEGRASPLAPGEIVRRVREGILQSFTRRGLAPPRADPADPRATVVASLQRGRYTFALDLAGKVLDKRGYRLEGHPAPLKETLAAAVLRLAGYDGTQPLLDPCCGSGTLAIEAALLALRKPPLMHSGKGEFGIEWLRDLEVLVGLPEVLLGLPHLRVLVGLPQALAP